jgi:hypothetical protein
MSRYDAYGEFDDKLLDVFDTSFMGFNNRLKADSLNSGILVNSSNFRFDLEGIAQVRKGITLTKAPLVLDADNALTLDFYIYENLDSTSVTRTGTTQLTFTRSSQWHIASDELVGITVPAGITGFTEGNYKGTLSGDGQDFVVTGLSGLGGTATGPATIGAPFLQDAFITQVHGSCNFSDPYNNGEEYIILAGNTKAFAIKISDQSSTEITYPLGVQISSAVDLIQAFDKVFIFRDGLTALEFDGNLASTPTFEKVESGSFTQPKLLNSTSNTTIEDGKVSVAEIAHNLQTGDEIVVVDSGHASLADGSSYSVTRVDADNFFFFAEVDDDPTAHTSIYISRVSVGGGYIHMPAPPYAVAHSFRLVCPFNYDVDDPDDSFTPRNIDDQIVVSATKRPDKFDRPFSKLSTTESGVNDSLVGMFSFAEDQLLLFNRKSIHALTGINSVNFTGTKRELITSELGLVSRKSIVQVGNNVIFLSDNGIYGASFQDLYNLRGNEVPLSESINETIENVNKSLWDKSVAVYFDNRYYIAVPLDYTDRNGNSITATGNNAVLVYNFLNKAWESVDTIGQTSLEGNSINFEIQNMIVAGEGSNRGVYVVNSLGGVHRLEGSTNAVDLVITKVGQAVQNVPIESEITSRLYNAGTIDRKKWNSFEIQCQSSDELSSNFTIQGITENLDNLKTIGTLSSFNNGSNLVAGEDISIRGRIGNLRGYGFQFKISPTAGRPKIKIIKASGASTFKSTESAI